METITVIEAVRRAIDPWGMNGQHTSAMRPSASEVIDRLAELGFVVIPRLRTTINDEPVSESEQRVLDGNR